MVTANISDLSASFRMRNLNADLQRRSVTLGMELASGQVADISKKINGRLDQLGALNRSVKMKSSYETATTELQNRATVLQSSLSIMQNITESTGVKLLSAATTPTDLAINATSAAAAEGFKTIVGSLNTQLSGRSLYAGTAFDAQAVQPASDILDSLVALTAGATTSTEVIQAVDTYFNQPGGGFEMSGYLGSATSPDPVRISDSEKASIPVTAKDTRLRKTLQSLALASLLNRGVFSGSNTMRAEILKQAGNEVITATGGLISLRAEIGGKQERLDIVATENQAGKVSLKKMLDGMTRADGYETATEFKAVQMRLEALYISTSRLSQLSLVKFLR